MNNEPNKPVELTEKELEGVVGGALAGLPLMGMEGAEVEGVAVEKGNKSSVSAATGMQFFKLRINVQDL